MSVGTCTIIHTMMGPPLYSALQLLRQIVMLLFGSSQHANSAHYTDTAIRSANVSDYKDISLKTFSSFGKTNSIMQDPLGCMTAIAAVLYKYACTSCIHGKSKCMLVTNLQSTSASTLSAAVTGPQEQTCPHGWMPEQPAGWGLEADPPGGPRAGPLLALGLALPVSIYPRGLQLFPRSSQPH